MCQACLALARRRSGASGWPLAEGAPPAPARFAAAAEWADAPQAAQAVDPPARQDDDPPVDAPRS
jgi:hypothetical protein